MSVLECGDLAPLFPNSRSFHSRRDSAKTEMRFPSGRFASRLLPE